MRFLQLITALICVCLLCIPVSAETMTEQTDLPETVIKSAPVLLIDNAHMYEYMQQSYSQGYEPLVTGDYAVIVLPLCCEGEEKPKSLRVSVGLEPDSPFVVKNYEQTVPLAMQTDNSGALHEIYLAEFWLAMHGNRINGCYPVQLQVADFGAYTVYVNITDGTDPNYHEPEPMPEPRPEPKEEPVSLMPKILVQNADSGSVQAGEAAELHITLKNTSHTESLQNLTVTASAAAPFSLQSADTLYFENIAANAEFEAVFVCQAASDAAAGSYPLPLQFDFAYSKGMTGAGSGNARLTVTQPVRMEFPTVVLPAEAIVSDRLELHIQALNLGAAAAQNVRAELTCDGLLPEGTAFLGSVSGGTSADGVLNVQVTAKCGGDLYGETSGKIVFTYEDAFGKEHTESQTFTVMLKSPFSERSSAPKQASPKYWVWIMAGISGGILLLTAYLIIRHRKRVQP